MSYKHELPAFPYAPSNQESGMTLRDWFAGQVLVGLSLDVDNSSLFAKRRDGAAEFAYRMADAMLEAREKQP